MAMIGAWDFSGLQSEPLPQEVATGLAAIKENGFVGSTIEPIKVLGKQVVNGINYAVLAKVTPTTLYAQTKLGIIEFNQKGVGNTAKYKFIKLVDIKL